MDKYWTFRVYIAKRGEDEFSKWLDNLPKKARAKIVRTLKYLEVTQYWERPSFSKLTGYKDLYEIRVKHNNNEYRPIGCYGPGRGDFTILICAIEKGDKFIPREAPQIAVRRSKLINEPKHTAEFIDS
ncbi:MAG: type II toxin-antitoxin system RelE/ParE family toxin [Deltaproteobacteria bacterium]|nr:type II toxin-antitoxin system RelE/ParE family toxin [Deltaproteobacteria bacterium]MBZ0220046.1 type II toxin-antitoxin system RelE/ParE family toxin [Deltaproteobacteria bacterium]